jgi:hypothetical protein
MSNMIALLSRTAVGCAIKNNYIICLQGRHTEKLFLMVNIKVRAKKLCTKACKKVCTNVEIHLNYSLPPYFEK